MSNTCVKWCAFQPYISTMCIRSLTLLSTLTQSPCVFLISCLFLSSYVCVCFRMYALVCICMCVRSLSCLHPSLLFVYGLVLSHNRRYSHGVRSFFESFSHIPNWTIGDFKDTYIHELAHAQYGLAPEGWTLDTTRLWDYLAWGVVPVVIADGVILPFEDDIDWNSFIVRVRRDEVHMLPRILDSIPHWRWRQMQRRVWETGRAMNIGLGTWHYIARALCRVSFLWQPTMLPLNLTEVFEWHRVKRLLQPRTDA